jgi:hypothetical protein
MMIDSHQRHSLSQCVTCAGQPCRHQRHTPLGGVTIVTLFELVPMSPFPTMGLSKLAQVPAVGCISPLWDTGQTAN